jgi:hypothetical protein
MQIKTEAGCGAGVALTTLARGQIGRVCGASMGADDAALLRAMGLRRNTRVRLCRMGEPCIVALECRDGEGCRIGLAQRLAAGLMVEPVA